MYIYYMVFLKDTTNNKRRLHGNFLNYDSVILI